MKSAVEAPLLTGEDIAATGGFRRRWRSPLVVASLISSFILLTGMLGKTTWKSSSRGADTAKRLRARQEMDVCGAGWNSTLDGTGDTPRQLRILGGPQPPPRQEIWQPDSSNSIPFSGLVDLCLDGTLIEGVKMKTRGHISVVFPKHQFSLKLPRAIGLLGMAPSKHWVLATSFLDTSYQRNPLAFDVYRGLGGWATQTRYVDLQWHDTLYGLYYIGEKIQRGKNRLSVPKARTHKPESSGYLLAVDWPKTGKTHVVSNLTNTSFNIMYPGKQSASSQISFLQGFVDRLDTVVSFGHGSVNTVIDLESMARHFVVQELAMDIDGYAFSDYFLVQEGRLFHAAPWDFDLAFNFDCEQHVYGRNAFTNTTTQAVEGWNVENLRDSMIWKGSPVQYGLNKRQFFLNLWSRWEFANAFAKSWRLARSSVLSNDNLTLMVRSRATAIQKFAERDIAIWRQSKRCAFYSCCHPADGQSFADSTSHLMSYLLARTAWIDAHVDEYVDSRLM